MINMIKRDVQLAPYLKQQIEDEGIEVAVDPAIQDDEIAIIKVDEYYAGLRSGLSPKSIDFIAVVDCQCQSYAMYLLELKNVNSPTRLNIPDIQEKFSNTISGFLSDAFSNFFLNDSFKYKSIQLYLISDAYNECGRFDSHEEYLRFRNRINGKDSLKTELSLGSKLYKFRGRILKIKYDIPPNPLIRHFH